MKAYLTSVGCRLNQSELEMIARQLVAGGAQVVEDVGDADICVVNTCAVTANAERKSYHLVRSLARQNPEARIAVVGCWATLRPQQCAALPGVEWVLSNSVKLQTAAVVQVAAGPGKPAGLSAESGLDPLATNRGFRSSANGLVSSRRTRAFVKVQDGCNNSCTYCISRRLRPVSYSRPLAEVVSEVNVLVSEGFKEVVLCGLNLGSYGRDLGVSGGLFELARMILSDTDLPRLRLSSIEPWDVDESFFLLWKDSRMCRQIHLPLQAGCDQTLSRMGRRITLREFWRLVEAARATSPDMAITTDVIVGFPGEDERAFESSFDFVAKTRFARVHVFSYSHRPDTAASRLPDHVPRSTIKMRATVMRDLAAQQAREFQSRFVGREAEVLWERKRSDGWYRGLTDNYLRVGIRSSEDLHNRLTQVLLVEQRDGWLVGQPIAG